MYAYILGEKTARFPEDSVDTKDFKMLISRKAVGQYYLNHIWRHDYSIALLYESENPGSIKKSSKYQLVDRFKEFQTRTQKEISDFKKELVQNLDDAYAALPSEKSKLGLKYGLLVIPEIGFAHFGLHPHSINTSYREIVNRGDNTYLYVTKMRRFATTNDSPEEFFQKMLKNIREVLFPRFPQLEYIQFDKGSDFEPLLAKESLYCSLHHRLYTFNGFCAQSIGASALFQSDLAITSSIEEKRAIVTISYKGSQVGNARIGFRAIMSLQSRGGWNALADFIALKSIIQTVQPMIVLHLDSDLYVVNKSTTKGLMKSIEKGISADIPGLVTDLPPLAKLLVEMRQDML